MAAAKRCFAVPLGALGANKRTLFLPHNEIIHLGKNNFACVTDEGVRLDHMDLKADYNKRIVEFSYHGPVESGFNGFRLVEGKTYTAKHQDVLEVSYGGTMYKIRFEPEIQEDDEKKSGRDLASFAKILKMRAPDTIDGEWKCLDDSLLLYTTGNINGNRIAAFGWLFTLVITKLQWYVTPQDKDDWRMEYDNIQEHLVHLHSQGYNIVAFSNHLWSDLRKQNLTKADLKEMVVNIVEHIGVPMTVFIALKHDIYAMPAPGMWYQLLMLNEDIKVEESFIVGHNSWEELFAMNIGLTFYPSEQFFLGSDITQDINDTFDPSTVRSCVERIPVTSRQEVIMMVGHKGSGKTHFCINNLVRLGYLHFEREVFSSMDNYLSAIGEKLREKQSIVIDAANTEKDVRALFLQLCKQLHVPCRCFHLDVSVKHCAHNIRYRHLVDPEYITPYSGFNWTKKVRKDEPTLKEGFSEVHNIQFNANFEHKEHELLYNMHLLVINRLL